MVLGQVVNSLVALRGIDKLAARVLLAELGDIAWKAQKRLCGRYKTLTQAGKNAPLVCVAIARELAGFIWDIVGHEMPKVVPAK